MSKSNCRLTVYANASCHVRPAKQVVTLPPTRTGTDFSLVPKDQLISGRVQDTHGALLCGATVSAAPSGGNGAYSDSTQRNGLYALQVPTGTYTVRATQAGYGPAPDRMVTVPPYARGMDFVLQVPDHSIQGTRRDSHGAVISGATVTASGSGGSVSAASGADGRYTIAVLGGSWTVSAAKSGYVTFTGAQRVSVPPDRSGIDFLLVPQGDVRRTYVPIAVKP